MTEVSQLQALVDQYVSRGAVDQMPQELRQAVDAFQLRTDDPRQRRSRMTERHMAARDQYEFKPQSDLEKRIAAESAATDTNLYRLPNMDTEDPNDGDVYTETGVFPFNVTNAYEIGDQLGEWGVPFSETLGFAAELPMSVGRGAASLVDSAGMGLPSALAGEAVGLVDEELGDDIAYGSKDYREAAWQRHQAMPTLQTGAATLGAVLPYTQATRLANLYAGAFGRSTIGQMLAGGAGGRFGLEAAAQGEGNFEQDFADELKDMDPGELGALVGAPFETGTSMAYVAPALGFVAPGLGPAATRARSAIDPAFRARRIAASNLDTNEIRGLANRQGDVRAVDLNPRLGNTAVDLGTQGPDSGGAQLSEYLQNRRSERAPRIFDRLSDDLGDDASVELRPHNQRNILGRSQADVRTEPMRYGTAIDQSERFMGSLEEAQGVARNRGYAELSGARLPDEEFDLSRPDTATTHRAATTLQRQARDMGLTGSSAQRESLEGRRFGIDGRREIPAPYTVTRNGQAVTIDPLFERRNNRPVISNNDIDNMLAERGIARTDLNGTQRRAALRDIRNQEMEAGPRAPATDQELARNPLRIQEIKRQAEGRQAAQLGPSGDPQRAGDFGLIARNARNLLERFRDASNNRPGLVGNRYFAAFERALSISRDQGGDITRVSGAYADGQKVFSGGDKFGPEMIRDRVDQMNRRIRDAEADPDFANVPGTRTNIAEATREELHAFRVGALRGYLRNIQNRTQEGGRLFNPRNPDVEARLSAIFDTPEQAQRYLDFLEDERQMAVTEGLIEGNSKTARSRADQERFEQNAESIGEAVTDLMTGAPGASTVRLLGRWFNRRYQRMWRGMTERTADEVARLLMRQDFEALATELEAARAGRRPPRMGALPVGTQARMAAAADVVDAADAGGRVEPDLTAAPRQSLSADEPIPPDRSEFYKLQRSLFEKYNTRPGDSIEEAYHRGEIEEADYRAWSAAQRRAAASETAQEPDARTPGDYRRAVQDDERAIAEEIRTNDAKEDLPVLDAGSIGAVPDGQLNRGTANNVYRALRARLLALPEADQRRIIADIGEVAEIDPKRASTLENAADRLIGLRVNRTRVYGEKLIRPLLQRLEDEISASEGGRRAGLGGDLDRTPRASLGRDGANARADQYVSIVKDLKGNVAAAREIAKIAAEDATLTPDARRRIIEALTSSSAKTGSAKELSDAIDLTAKKAWDKEFIFLGEDTAGGQAARAAIGRHRNDAAGIVARARETLDAPPIPVDDGTRPPSMWGVVGDADRAGDDLDPTNRSSRRIDRERAGPGERTPIRSRADREAQNLEITGRQYDGTILAGRLRKAAEHPAVSPDLRLRVERYIGGISRTGLREADEIGTGRRKGFSGRDLQPATHADRPVETVSLSGRQGRPSNNEVDRFDNFEDGRRLLNEIERVVDEAEARRAPAQPGAAAGEGANGARPQPPDRAPADETPPDSPADIVPERAPAPWDTIEGGYTRPIAEIDSAVTKVRDDIRNLIRLVKGERLPDGIEYKDISRLRDKAEQDLTKASIRLATLGEDSPQAQVLRNTIDDQFLALVQAQDAFGRLGADLGERFDDVASGMRDVSRMGDTGRNPRLPGAGEDITPGFTYGDWDKVRAHLAGDAPEDALLVEIVENIEARMGEAGPTAAGRMLNDVDKTKFKVLLSRALANADDAAEEIAHIVYALDMIPAKEMAEVRKIAKRWHVAESKRLGHDFLEPYRREAQRLGLSPEQTREMLEEELVVKWLSRSETWKQPKGLKGRVAAILRQMGQLIKRAVSTSAKASQRADRFQSGRMAKDIEKALVDAMTKGTREAMEGRSPVREIVRASRSLETAGQ